MMGRVFIVDDDLMSCVLASRVLRNAGYDVRYGHDGNALFQVMAEWAPQLVVLDIHLDGEDGRSIARRLRSISSIPILILTGSTDLQTKVQSLDLGADDFLSKPFAGKEFVARVRALLRRAALPAYRGVVVPSSRLWLDHDKRMLVVPGVGELVLTEAELRLLELLLIHAGNPLDRETLSKAVLRRLWQPGERSLDLHVSNLRNKLRKFAPQVLQIQSVRGIGYRLLLSDDQ